MRALLRFLCRRGRHDWILVPQPLYTRAGDVIGGVCARCEHLAVWDVPDEP